MSGEQPPDDMNSDVDAAPRARMPKRAWMMAAATFIVGLFSGFAIASDPVPPAPLTDGEQTVTPAEGIVPGDGTYLVGVDIKPGLYHSYRNASNCSWSRTKDASGEKRSVIAEDESGGDSYVHLNKGEFFDTTHCRTWKRVQEVS